MKRAISILILLLVSIVLMGDTIQIKMDILYPDTPAYRDPLMAVLENGAYFASKIYGEHITVYTPDNKTNNPQYVLGITATDTGTDKVIALNMSRTSDGAMVTSAPLLEEWTPELGEKLSQIIFYLWGSFDGFARFKLAEGPKYIEELSSAYILPEHSVSLQKPQYIASIDLGPDNNLYLGALNSCFVIDSSLRVLGERGQYFKERNNFTFAYGVRVSTGGTIFYKPASGNEIFKQVEGRTRPAKLRINSAISGAFTVLPNGDMVVYDYQTKQGLRFSGTKKYPFDVELNEYTTLLNISAGPEGNVWLYDGMAGLLKVVSPDGVTLKTIKPLLPEMEVNGGRIVVPYGNGDFLLTTYQSLWKFDRQGVPKWRIQNIPDMSNTALAQINDIAVDHNTGLIYLADYTGGRIIKLLDDEYADSIGADLPMEREILAINEQYSSDLDDVEYLKAKAELYENMGALALAKMYWEQVFNLDPFDFTAEARLEMLEIIRLENFANSARMEALDRLDFLGPESARSLYNSAVQMYEKLLALDPNNIGAQADLDNLKERFLQKEARPDENNKPLLIKKVNIENLFPSMMQYYRNNSIGTVSFQNNQDGDITDVRASIFLKKYMDFPTQSEVIPSVEKGKDAEIDLKVLFNGEVFRLEEDLPVIVQVTLTYNRGGREYKQFENKTLVLHRRTALTWDNSAKLATFIMPNEEVVSGFSHKVSSAGGVEIDFNLSNRFLRGIRICDALGAYGIEYIEDPYSPISKIFDEKTAVDTVRFPRTTLFYKAGDCDDTTALLGSLLEAAGIGTAIMTSPGHVFLAFNTNEPEENAWQFETDDLRIMKKNGTIWIPIETTILEEGFYVAWKKASELIKKHNGDVEIIPVSDHREEFPSLSLPGSTFQIIEPPLVSVDGLVKKSIDKLYYNLYDVKLAELTNEKGRLRGRRLLKLLNKIGILHARFGEKERALDVFAEAIRSDDEYISSYVNMANIYIGDNDYRKALDTLEKARRQNPDSLMLQLVLAQVYYQDGNMPQAVDYYTRVEEASPAMAARISYIKETDTIERASSAEGIETLLWMVDE